MTATPNHDEVQELLPAAALEILDGVELQQVLAHASHCSGCAMALEKYREVATDLTLQLPSRPFASGRAAAVRTRLLARAAGERSSTTAAHRRSLIAPLSGWLVAAGLAGVLLVHHSIHRSLDYGWLAAGVLVVALLGLGIYAWAQRSRVLALEDRLGGRGSVRVEDDRAG